MRPMYPQQRNNPHRQPYQMNAGGLVMNRVRAIEQQQQQGQYSYGGVPPDRNMQGKYNAYNNYGNYNNNPNNMNPNSQYDSHRGLMYGGMSGYNSFASMSQLGQLQRQSSIMSSGAGSQFGGFPNRRSASFGSLYHANSFMGGLNNGGYGSFHGSIPGVVSGNNNNNGFARSGSFQKSSSNYSNFPSAYGSSYFRQPSVGSSSANPVLQRTGSGINFGYDFGSETSGQNFNNGIPGFHQKPSQSSFLSQSSNNGSEDGGLVRHNSMTLIRTNSATNGFYDFGPVVQTPMATGNVRRLSQGRLSDRPAAPPRWQGNINNPIPPSSAVTQGKQQALPRVGRLTDQRKPNGTESNETGELTRKASEKRIGMYFKDVQPSGSDGYKKEGDPGTGRNARSTDPSSMTRVRTVLLLCRNGGNTIEVDGSTAILQKPNSDELQKFDTNEIVCTCSTEPSIFAETLDELRDNFVQGCNVALIMADSECPAHLPSGWFTWNALRRMVKGTFARISHRSEFTVSVSLLEDDQVMDLLVAQPHYTTLTVAQSPLFGNVPHGVVYQLVDDATEFEQLLDSALAAAVGNEGEERGILLVSAVLKQIRTPTNSDEEDVILSSLFATGVGDGIIHYKRILDKNPAEPRAMFQFALGGPAMTATVFSVMDREDNESVVSNFLCTLNRMGEIQNYRLRLGSLRRFVRYSEESIPKTRTKINETAEGREKEALRRSLARLELMVADAKVMLESPDSAVPKAYIRQ
ncbi:hypothetical protein LSM04_007791 [Trypanosoma melophagium]|uniref:uncharacterized protein n=1 Tax=Trypanosoma melophagium TaxID=715481 RepID=UPI00351A6664|nr:hypothetical protein LSM04_007791 [Trypanosoma melophagium]